MKRFLQFFGIGKPASAKTVEMRLGTDGPIYLDVPQSFQRQVIDHSEVLIRPKEDSKEAPVTLRITRLRNVMDAVHSAAQLQELLEKLNPGSQIFAFGSNAATTQKREDVDEFGVPWLQLHHAIFVDGFLCTATVSIRKGMERAPEVGILRDALTDLFGSLRVKEV